MGQEIAHAPEGGAPAPANRWDQNIEMVRQALLNPAVNAENARVMADLMISLEDRQMQAEFNRDRMAAIAEMPVITKDGRIIIPANSQKGTPEREQGRFAKLEDIDRVVKPIALRHNIAYSWDVGDDGGVPKVFIELSHANGFVWRSAGMRLPLDTSGAKNNVQGAGSAVTYGKRYTLCAAFNIQTEGADDDGSLGQTVTLPHERAQAVLADAQRAFDEGRYDEWYRGQSPKDRGYLVTSGKHAGFGGEPALPAPKPETRVLQPEQPQADPPAGKGDPDEQRRGWVANYCAQARACADQSALDDLKRRYRERLDQIRDNYPDLWREITAAHSSVGRPAEGDMFGEAEG